MSDEYGFTPFQFVLLPALTTLFLITLSSFQSGTRRWLAVDSRVSAEAFGHTMSGHREPGRWPGRTYMLVTSNPSHELQRQAPHLLIAIVGNEHVYKDGRSAHPDLTMDASSNLESISSATPAQHIPIGDC